MAGIGAAELIRERFPELQLDVLPTGEVQLQVPAEKYREVCEALYKDYGLNYLSCLTAVDYKDRLELVLHLFALKREGVKVVVKVGLSRENPVVDSVTSIWSAANWLEREVYDMFGIVFTGHPDLRRILTWDEFQGYPLRKDYIDTRPPRPRLVRAR